MKELTIISGKGGAGKTSLTASFAALAENKILVDADVDAADLHLILSPDIQKRAEFKGGHIAFIDPDLCVQCGECRERCQFDAVSSEFVIDPIACEGCGVCVHFCPENAVQFPQRTCGEYFISRTRFGLMAHARLGIAEENSGMLVTLLRKEARALAEKENKRLIITDGPPGIGCPVIASVAGADAVLIVTEPTLSGCHDMKRVKELLDFLKIPALICINKHDLNTELSTEIKSYAAAQNMFFTGEIPFDRAVTSAMVAGKTLVEFSASPAAEAVKNVWEQTYRYIDQ